MTSSVHFDGCFDEFLLWPMPSLYGVSTDAMKPGEYSWGFSSVLLLNHFCSDNNGGWKAYAVDAEEQIVGDGVEVELYEVKELSTDCSGWFMDM